jgi:hypothetical protein
MRSTPITFGSSSFGSTATSNTSDSTGTTSKTTLPGKSTDEKMLNLMSKFHDSFSQFQKGFEASCSRQEQSLTNLTEEIKHVRENTEYNDEYYDEYEEDVDYEEEYEPSEATPHNSSQSNVETSNKRPSAGDTPDSEPNKKMKFLQVMGEAANVQIKKGPKIIDELATNITSLMRNRPEPKKSQEIMNSILVPENCPGLEMVMVNDQIWRKLYPHYRSLDTKIQRQQAAMLKGVTAVATVDKLLQGWDPDTKLLSEESMAGIMQDVSTAFQAFGIANYDFCVHRRETMKPNVDSEFKHLCSSSIPFTDKLFGDDVISVIKDMSVVNRVSKLAIPQDSNRGTRQRSWPRSWPRPRPWKRPWTRPRVLLPQEGSECGYC